MTTRDHDSFAEDVGAYLLGALEADEARTFEEHLSGCTACRDELAQLELARDALPRSVEQVDPPERLKATLMETVRAEADAAAAADVAAAGPARSHARTPARRSRWRELLLARPRFAAAAAAALLAVGVAVGAMVGALGGGDGDDPSTVAAQVDNTRMPAATASLVLPSEKGGAILRVEGMQQPQEGKVYEVWIQHDNQVTPSSLFTVDSEGKGAAAIPDDLEGADAVLVTREPEGGAKTPSEPSLVTVELSS